MEVPSNTRAGGVAPELCPNCDSTQVTCATLTERFVYLRCEACGEVWSIPERREKDRAGGARLVSTEPSDPSS
jgi:uncharacterized Zn finger protein